jgi:MoaA/NifB/PqqE/SkfB family radical SAM enzyme
LNVPASRPPEEPHPGGADSGALVEENLRLYRAVRGGAGPPCTKPWVSFEERSNFGQVKPCCWYQGRLGIIEHEDDVDAIWHGENYRVLRTAMASGAIPKECPHWCPLLHARREWFQKQELYEYSRDELASFDAAFLANRARVLRAILAGDAVMDAQPLRLHLHPSDVCNLRCIMCYLDLENTTARDWYGGARLRALMPYLEEIKVFGGEPLFCDTSRRLILSADKPRWTHTSFVTNGTLVTDHVIAELAAVRIGSVDVSLDAAIAPTYERIRLRGNFSKALAGARRLAELGRRHPIRQFTVYADFVIQEYNYRELEGFVRLCADLGMTPNFTMVGANREATRRALRQQTELGATPYDSADLDRQVDGALAAAHALKLDFAVESLQRVQGELHAPPA